MRPPHGELARSLLGNPDDATDEICIDTKDTAEVVTYDAKRCIHAAECVHGLPAVFDSNAKPWINPDGADADASGRRRRPLPERRAASSSGRTASPRIRAGDQHRDAHRPTARRTCAAISR